MVLEANHKIKSLHVLAEKFTLIHLILSLLRYHFTLDRRAVVLCLSDISVSEVEGMKVRILLSQGHGPSKQWHYCAQ